MLCFFFNSVFILKQKKITTERQCCDLEAQVSVGTSWNSLFKIKNKKPAPSDEKVQSWTTPSRKSFSSRRDARRHHVGCDCSAARLETTFSKSSRLSRLSVMLLLSSNLGRMTAMYPSVEGCRRKEDKCLENIDCWFFFFELPSSHDTHICYKHNSDQALKFEVNHFMDSGFI